MFWGCLFGHFGSQKGGEGRRGAAFPEDFPPRSRKVELLAGHQPLSLALAWFPVEESTCLPCSLQSEALALDTLSLSFCLVLFDFVGFSRLMFLLRSLPLPCCFFRPIYYLPTLFPHPSRLSRGAGPRVTHWSWGRDRLLETVNTFLSSPLLSFFLFGPVPSVMHHVCRRPYYYF